MARELLNFTFRKSLPAEFGGGHWAVTPKADRRVLSRGWQKAAPDLFEVARRFLQPGNIVWDIGSNLGIFSAFAAGKVGGSGLVYAVEADPTYAAHIAKAATQLPDASAQIQVLCAAIADRAGILQFNISAKGHARSSLLREAGESARQITVPAFALDDLLFHWKAPQFLKIDVERAESLVLKGAEKMLSDIRPKIYIEVSDDNAEFVGSIFAKYGYRLFKLSLDGRDTPITRPDFYTIALPDL
jgi:FkbM family methyltransferase